MNVLLTVVFLLQVVRTPVADGSLVVSNETIQFPELPEESEPTPINEDWELLYYEVYTGPRQYIIRGEVRNTSVHPLNATSLIVTLAGGSQLNIHPDVGSVGPGERAPFQHLVLDDEITAALNQSQQIQFTGVCEHYGVLPEQEFTWDFQDVEIDFDAARSAVQVSGNVTNMGETSAERYAPMLLVFKSDGHYVGSFAYGEAPGTIFGGDVVAFEMDHGFDTLHGSEPLAGAGQDPIFVLAMAQPVYSFVGCVE